MKRIGRQGVEILAGAVVLAMFGLFLFVAYASDPVGSGGYNLTARFSRVDGIVEGSEVRLVGMPVGTVTGQWLDPETNMAHLTMTIEPGIVLPVDTSASILSESVLGGKYIKLEPGGSLDMLGDGDAITYVQDAVILENIIERIVKTAERRRAERRGQEGDQ